MHGSHCQLTCWRSSRFHLYSFGPDWSSQVWHHGSICCDDEPRLALLPLSTNTRANQMFIGRPGPQTNPSCWTWHRAGQTAGSSICLTFSPGDPWNPGNPMSPFGPCGPFENQSKQRSESQMQDKGIMVFSFYLQGVPGLQKFLINWRHHQCRSGEAEKNTASIWSSRTTQRNLRKLESLHSSGGQTGWPYIMEVDDGSRRSRRSWGAWQSQSISSCLSLNTKQSVQLLWNRRCYWRT